MIRKTLSNIIMGTSLAGILAGGAALGYSSLEKERSAARLQTAEYFAPQVANIDPLDMACYREDFAFISKRVDQSKYALAGALALGLVGSAVGFRTKEKSYNVPERALPDVV